jgi:hypothetical protein
MGTCGMEHRITVSKNHDGTMSVTAESPCDQVRRYISSIGPITDMDLVDFSTSRLFDLECIRPLTMTCLVPSGIVHAAFLEAGMMAHSLAASAPPDSVRFIL